MLYVQQAPACFHGILHQLSYGRVHLLLPGFIPPSPQPVGGWDRRAASARSHPASGLSFKPAASVPGLPGNLPTTETDERLAFPDGGPQHGPSGPPAACLQHPERCGNTWGIPSGVEFLFFPESFVKPGAPKQSNISVELAPETTYETRGSCGSSAACRRGRAMTFPARRQGRVIWGVGEMLPFLLGHLLPAPPVSLGRRFVQSSHSLTCSHLHPT